jgi:hypothetical protein
MKALPGMENTKEDQTKIVRSQKYQQDQKKLKREIYVSFRNQEDVNSMARLLNVDITQKTKVFTYPINNLFSDTQEVASITKEKVSRRSEVWRKYWKQMPDYVQDDNPPFKQITIRFGSEADVDSFSKLISQNITDKTKSIWHPKLAKDDNAKKRWVIPEGVEELMPKYPLYIVSKGRYDKKIRSTANSLERMRVPFYMVVEPQEYDKYVETADKRYCNVIKLDMSYKENYDTCDDEGYSNPRVGPGAARNFAWDHAKKLGYDRYWVFDDNIHDFYRLYENQRIRVESGAMFRACEDFVDRFDNIPVSGLQYRFFIAPNSEYPPYVMNTRIYSALLIDTRMEQYKWRGRYNEDTDLSLRVLKDGLCTCQFNVFLQGKAATQTTVGGNTDEFYAVEDQSDEVLHGTSNKSDMQYRLHPDVSRNVWKYGRWHHYVDYSPFKNNKPILKDLKLKNEDNNYGLTLITNYGESDA